MIEGDPETALTWPDGVVITQSTAQRYFGNDDAWGNRWRQGSAKSLLTCRFAEWLRMCPSIRENAIPMVNADVALMERVLSNLIDNAIKHTPPAGSVTVSVGHKEGHVTISVRDTGKGIPKENLIHIFDRFYQVNKSRSNSKGGGLGLSIAQKILQLHNSTLRVESSFSQGTQFSFDLQSSTVG